MATKKTGKKAVDRKSAAANDTPKSEVVVSKKGLAARAAGLALYIKAGRPSHADFRRLCGPKGPSMTWLQRAEKLLLSHRRTLMSRWVAGTTSNQATVRSNSPNRATLAVGRIRLITLTPSSFLE